MPKGGARARGGRPQDPDALRRDRVEGEWTILPAEGRVGPTAVWPLTRPTLRELEVWVEEWRRPQAIMWERNGQELEVAMFVRALATAEADQAAVAARTLVRQQMDTLGLTVPGLRSNRWRIGDKETPAAPTGPPDTRKQPSAKDRLRLVRGQAS